MIAADPELRITDAESKKAAIEKVAPAYPLAARQLKVTGHVVVEAVVDDTGSVESVKPVSGNSMLTKPAADAVKKWRFKPFRAEDKPVRAIVTLSFDFG